MARVLEFVVTQYDSNPIIFSFSTSKNRGKRAVDPLSIRRDLIWRWGYNQEHDRVNQANINHKSIHFFTDKDRFKVKYAFRPASAIKLSIHTAQLKANSNVHDPNLGTWSQSSDFWTYDPFPLYAFNETQIPQLWLASNHYRMTSWEKLRQNQVHDSRNAFYYCNYNDTTFTFIADRMDIKDTSAVQRLDDPVRRARIHAAYAKSRPAQSMYMENGDLKPVEHLMEKHNVTALPRNPCTKKIPNLMYDAEHKLLFSSESQPRGARGKQVPVAKNSDQLAKFEENLIIQLISF